MQIVFDTALSTMRKRRALAQATKGADFLMKLACEDLADRLGAVERRFARAATLFCVTAGAAETLLASGKVDEVLRIEAAREIVAAAPGPAGVENRIAAPETVPLQPESIDLAVSLLSLHDVNDIPGMLIQIRRALRPDGLFLGSMAGGDTLHELRESLLAAEVELSGGASPRVAPFADIRDVGALLQRAGLALPVADVETVTVRYGDMFALLRDLRAMGVTNTLVARSKKPPGRSLFLRAAQIYAERFADPDGRIRATFSTVWMSGWAPDDSQQKALRPGSAKVSLASVLKDETSAD